MHSIKQQTFQNTQVVCYGEVKKKKQKTKKHTFISSTLGKRQNSRLFGIRICDGDEPWWTPEHSNSIELK